MTDAGVNPVAIKKLRRDLMIGAGGFLVLFLFTCTGLGGYTEPVYAFLIPVGFYIAYLIPLRLVHSQRGLLRFAGVLRMLGIIAAAVAVIAGVSTIFDETVRANAWNWSIPYAVAGVGVFCAWGMFICPANEVRKCAVG